MRRDGDDTVTWRTLLSETAGLLGDGQHARWVCEVATSTSPAEFTELLDEPATERAVAHLDAMVARARTGEPIQYVLGRWGFRRLDLAVDARALIPRPETEEVAGVAIELAGASGPIRYVADLGTGSGAIGLSMAHELPSDGTFVWMTDVSAEAIEVARANLAGLGRRAAGVRIAEGSWADALPAHTFFDVIVSNPPYVAAGSPDLAESVARWEPSGALLSGGEGLDDISVIVPAAHSRLRPGGWLVVEHGFDQAERVRSMFDAAGFESVETRRDLAGLDRMTLGRRAVALFGADSPVGRVTVRHLQNRLDDYAHLLEWFGRDEVLEWYEGRDQDFDLARILREYGPGGETERDETVPAIIELDGAPIGYIQLYELDDPDDAAEFDLDPASTGDPRGGEGIWSLDLFVGEPSLHGRGIGRVVCRAAAEFLLDEWGAHEVVILPYVENARAIAAYRAAGFDGDHVVVEHELHEGRLHDGLRLHYRRP